MKKTFLMLALLALLCALWVCACASEGAFSDYLKVSETELQLCIPEGWTYSWVTEAKLYPQSEGELNGGFYRNTFYPDETMLGEAYMVSLTTWDDQGTDAYVDVILRVSEEGKLSVASMSALFDGVLFDYGEGYTEEGRAFFVQTEGNPTTGYEWTYIPDNSGMLVLLDEDYTSYDVEEEEVLCGVGGVYSWVLQTAEELPGMTGTVLLQNARSREETPVEQMLYTLTVDDEGNITDVAWKFTTNY